jgi:hypothetical protein
LERIERIHEVVSEFFEAPGPPVVYVADDGVSTLVDRDMFHRNLLLAAASVSL